MKYEKSNSYLKRIHAAILVVGTALCCILALQGPAAHAAQTTPTVINFQGRLADSTGVPLADGSYNIRFRAYFNDPIGGSPTWTETHDGANRVTVRNGIFSTQLGSITPFNSSDFGGYTIYIETELPTLGTATCDGVGCSPSWTEGAMTPRQPIASNAYAMNADLVDGIDGASLAQLSANQTFTGNNTFTGTFLQQNTSTTAFRIQNAGGTNALLIDTSSNLAVKVGGGDLSPDASPALLVLDYKNTSGDPAGTEGAMYYNSAIGKMRCYEDDIWRDCIGRARTRLEERDDFTTPYAYSNAAQVHAAFVSGVAGGSVVHIAGEATHPGIIRASTGSSATGIFGLAMNFDTLNPIQFGGGTWTFTTSLRVANASTSAQRFTLYNGFYDNIGSMIPVSGCYFRYVDNQNSDRWQGVCRNSNNETGSTCNPVDGGANSAATVAAAGAATWYDLRVRVNAAASLATFTMNNSTNIYTCTVSTNIPTTNKVAGAIGMLKSIGTTPRTVDYDTIEVIGDGLNR